MRHRISTAVGKTVKHVSALRGGGSALPGLVVEKIDRAYMARVLLALPKGVVLISGTNGKTTTTKMVVALLESQGLRVFTNRTGSNFTRGVTASLLGEVTASGKLNADIAVLELDEAHAVHFVKQVAPTHALFLNVMRDQLDRFGEIDMTASLLRQVALATTRSIVINRDDPRLASGAFLEKVTAQITTYGVDPSLLHHFPSDDTLRSAGSDSSNQTRILHDDTCLVSFEDKSASIQFGNQTHEISLALKGIYNVHNAVGAVAIVRAIMNGELDETAMLAALSQVTPAFGRGETIRVGNVSCELVLVKNPSGFRLGLSSFDSKYVDTMIAINDDYADGRDMSWLWDVDFSPLLEHGVAVVSGTRAYDMALRLQYDNVSASSINPDLRPALEHLLTHGEYPTKRIFCTYTAMLALRRALSKRAAVETIR